MTEEKSQKICKRCLFKDLSEDEFRSMIGQHIDFIDEHDKVPEDVYENRLMICRQCDKLSAGTCLSCGCYVEIRAIMKKGKCPYKKWN